MIGTDTLFMPSAWVPGTPPPACCAEIPSVQSSPPGPLLVESIRLWGIRLLTLRGWGDWPQGAKAVVLMHVVRARREARGHASCDTGDMRAPSHSTDMPRRTALHACRAGELGVRCAVTAGGRAAADLNRRESCLVCGRCDGRKPSGATPCARALCQGLACPRGSDLPVAAFLRPLEPCAPALFPGSHIFPPAMAWALEDPLPFPASAASFPQRLPLYLSWK